MPTNIKTRSNPGLMLPGLVFTFLVLFCCSTAFAGVFDENEQDPMISGGMIVKNNKQSSVGRKKILHQYQWTKKSAFKRIPGYLPSMLIYDFSVTRKKKEIETGLETSPRIKFNSDEIRHDEGVTTAVGNVRVEFRGVVMKADRISYDQKTKTVTATGSVNISRNNNELEGDTLTFNVETNAARITNAKGTLRNIAVADAELQKEAYVWGDEIIWDNEKIFIKNGKVTSCNNPPSKRHFLITGGEIIIIPRQKMKIRKARFFVNGNQVLGLHSLAIPLKPRRRNQHLLIPRIGRNNLEGVYVKESIGYEYGKKDFGTLMLDWYEKVGIGAGIEHNYHLGERGAGRFNYYSMGSSRSPTSRYDLSNRFYYQFPGNLFMSGNYQTNRYEFPNFSSPNIKNADFFMSHHDKASSSALYLRDYVEGNDRNYGFNIYHRRDLTERLKSDLVLDYLSSESSVQRRFRLNTLARFVQQGDIFDTWLMLENTWGDSKFYVNRLPEVALRSHAIKTGPFNSKVSLAVGSFKEMPSNVSAVRSDLKFSLLNNIFDVGKSGNLAVAAGARQFVYSTGEKKYLVRTRAALEERIGNNFRVIFSHFYQDRNGFSPLAFDTFDKYNLLGTTFEIYKKKKARFHVTGAYDLDRKIYQSIIPRLELTPNDRTHFLFGSTYDHNNKLWMNIDGQVGFRVTKNIYFKYWGLYNLINKKMTYQNYVVELDHHDFATRFVYKGSQGELWLNLSLKLFPYDSEDVGPDPTRRIINKGLLRGAPDEPVL